MKNKIIYLLIAVNVLILIIYSSEIRIISNYNAKPDKLYLFIPFLLFGLLFTFLFLGYLYFFIKKQISVLNFTILLLSIIFFLFLNNPKGNFQLYGFIGIFFLIIKMLFILKNKIR